MFNSSISILILFLTTTILYPFSYNYNISGDISTGIISKKLSIRKYNVTQSDSHSYTASRSDYTHYNLSSNYINLNLKLSMLFNINNSSSIKKNSISIQFNNIYYQNISSNIINSSPLAIDYTTTISYSYKISKQHIITTTYSHLCIHPVDDLDGKTSKTLLYGGYDMFSIKYKFSYDF